MVIMAVDTRNRRFSMLGLAFPSRAVLPDPDGSFERVDRLQLSYRYPLVTVGGFMCIPAGMVYVPGAQALQRYRPGAASAQVYTPGAQAAERAC